MAKKAPPSAMAIKSTKLIPRRTIAPLPPKKLPPPPISPPHRKRVISNKCDPQSIVDTIEAIDNNDDKINYIINMLDACSTLPEIKTEIRAGTLSPPKTTPSEPKTKKKRQMTGWNCAMKICAKEDNNLSFHQCLKNEVYRKNYYQDKEQYNEWAAQGCPVKQILETKYERKSR